MILKCVKCNEPLMKPGEEDPKLVGLVCGNPKCDRFGLLTVIGKKEENQIITPVKPGEIIVPNPGGISQSPKEEPKK